MRLQLTIQRHHLPAVPILWNVSSHTHGTSLTLPTSTNHETSTSAANTQLQLHQSSSPSTTIHEAAPVGLADKTIAQLLEDVNEKIPLESEDGEGGGWGLEDYAVKNVSGYECLHYAKVLGVLRDGEEVSIRALTWEERKARRLGGREQITRDGQHLIDGRPFGRPWVKRPVNRPIVSIPPRKKARLELEWDAQGQGQGPPEVFADAEFGEDGEESEDDEDYVEAGEEEEGSEDLDGDGDEDEDEGGSVDDEDKENVPSRQVMLRTDFDDADVDEEMEEGEEEFMGLGDDEEGKEDEEEWQGFDGVDEDMNGGLEVVAIADECDALRRSKRLRGGQVKPVSARESLGQENSGSGLSWRRSENVTVRKRQARCPPVEESNQVSTASALVPILEDSTAEEDGDSDDSESTTRLDGIVGGTSLQRNQILEDDETSSSGTSSSESSSESSSDSDSDSDSDSEDSSLSTSSSSSSSSEEEESEVEEQPAILPHTSPLASMKIHKVAEHQILPSPTKAAPPPIQAEKPANPALKSPQKPNPPGHGKMATRSRNQRNRLKRLKDSGKLPPDATLEDLDAYSANLQNVNQASETVIETDFTAVAPQKSNEQLEETGAVQNQVPERSEFEQKKQELLDAIASGGVDVNMLDKNFVFDSETGEVAPGPILVEARPLERAIAPTSTAADQTMEGNMSEPSRKRTKLDISSTRRLLFGSLGVRAPKTKEDEEATRQKLAGSSRTPRKQHDKDTTMDDPNSSTLIADDTPVNKVLVLDSQGDKEAWKEKIILKAVECCYEGVELSTPPFPFVQRWDPQQQSRGQKRRRGNGEFAPNRHNEQQLEQLRAEEDPDDQLNYDDEEEGQLPENPSLGDNGAIRDQLMREADGLSASSPRSDSVTDDFPPIPADLTNYPELKKENATFGSIIAFKELRLDETWSPVYTGFLTAHIDRVEEDGSLKMTLARRDWKKQKVTIDEETGERTYEKLEMPDEEEDDGKRLEPLGNLIEPKLIKAGEPYYEPLAEENAVEEERVEDSATGQEGHVDMTMLMEPLLEPEVERRSSFSVLQESQDWPSDGENGEEQTGSAAIENPSPELGGTDEPKASQEPSIPQVDGGTDGPSEPHDSGDIAMGGDGDEDDSFFYGEAVVQETPAASFHDQSAAKALEVVPEAASPATSPPRTPTATDRLMEEEPVDSQAIAVEPGMEESWITEKDDSLEVEQTSLNDDDAGKDNESDGQISSPRFNGFGSSPSGPFVSPRHPQTNKTLNGKASAKSTPKGKNKPKAFDTPGYPKLPIASESDQNAIQNGEDDVAPAFNEAPGFGDDDADIVEDSIVVSGTMQDGQQVNAPRHEISEDDSLLKPITLSKEDSTTSRNSHRLDGVVEDDDELPDLDQIFSSTAPARMTEISPPSINRKDKKPMSKVSKEPEKEEFRRWPFSQPSQEDTSSKPDPKPSKRKSLFSSKRGNAAYSQDRPLEFLDATDPESAPSLPPNRRSESQIPEGSLVVDLTQMSSDPISPQKSDTQSIVSSRDLPGGSGWVKKEIRSTRSRSSQEPERNGRKRSGKVKRSVI